MNQTKEANFIGLYYDAYADRQIRGTVNESHIYRKYTRFSICNSTDQRVSLISLGVIKYIMPTSLQLLPVWIQITLAIVPSIGAALAAAGLYLNVLQSRRTDKQSRATLVSTSLREFSSDDEMRAIFYSIEYSEFKYEDDFHNSPEERKLDKVLVHFSNLALAWQAGLLTNTDIEPVQYFVRRLLRDEGVKQYLQFVENWTDHAELGEHPYAALTKMGKALGA